MKQIELVDFSAYYKLKKEYVVALDRVSLSVDQGEFVTVVGPSGCGKSTLLKCILGQVDLTEGKLLLCGKEPSDETVKKANVAYVAENYQIYPHLSVYENIAFPLRMAEQDPDEVDERVRSVAERCGLAPALLNRRPRQLSAGQQQRVALARAFVKKPDLVLVDEPFSHLDPPLRAEFRSWLLDYHAETGATFVFVTHDEEEARILGGRLIRMGYGTIVDAEDTSRYGNAVKKLRDTVPNAVIHKTAEPRRKTLRTRLLYRWPLYLLGFVVLGFVIGTLWNRFTEPDGNEKLSITFVGEHFRDAEAQRALSTDTAAFTAQRLRELNVESLYNDNGALLAEAVTVRCIGDTDFLILEEDYVVDEMGSRYFCEIPLVTAERYFPGAVFYMEGDSVYGVRMYAPEEDRQSTAFSEYYDGSQTCWLFFTIGSKNTASMNGLGAAEDTAALDLAAYLWRAEQ